MSANFQLLGSLSQAPNGRRFIVAGTMQTNLYGRVQNMTFQLPCVLTKDIETTLKGVVPGSTLLVNGRLIGTSEPGGVLLLASTVHVLPALPSTERDKQYTCSEGINFATLGANVISPPVTEEFRGNQLRVTFLASFNTRNDSVRVVCMGSHAKDYAQLAVGDRVNLTGHLAQETRNDPLGRPAAQFHFEMSRADTESAADYQARTSKPRKSSSKPGSPAQPPKKNEKKTPSPRTAVQAPQRAVNPSRQTVAGKTPQKADNAPSRPSQEESTTPIAALPSPDAILESAALNPAPATATPPTTPVPTVEATPTGP